MKNETKGRSQSHHRKKKKTKLKSKFKKKIKWAATNMGLIHTTKF